ncbi:CDP-glycerol glycerophosphotransferase family protein [Helicobacter sp. MIT 21-1697]|uniref:CDP-glycerol glycerophosphotransferase family protein n=1 Tax=Helicobacter sp. MIT 21-1697 TaxID=2993733 RepID=UPI00224A5D43|nr:CDP-glycerol glycerophosphotransferase family protein [Helicobacter sp. MIT 21-1697]MCX2717881.1 CDP-glycerol glycerophosphotransferase family protein [Helicobacter sp. MIT 21-1697]
MSILSKNSYLKTKYRAFKEKNKNSYLRVKWRTFREAKKALKLRLKILYIRKKIESKVQVISQKSIIKVAFLQMYIAECQNFSLFEKFLKDNRFEPYFIVNPDIARSEENFITQYKKTYEELANKYSGGGAERVLNGYDFASKTFIDYTQEFDLMTTANPYDEMAHQFFKIAYWTQKCIPIFYISYFYLGRCLVSIDNLKLETSNYIWKFFAENEEVIKLAQKYQIIKGANLVLSGYPKMDSLAHHLKQAQEPAPTKKLRIIIAPHHSIYEAQSAVGSFLKYYEILYRLMAKNTNIDFIFRPHPLLFAQLAKEDFWGEAKTQSYFDKICALNNVTYSTQGDYMEVFANSDALIHDCGSFMAEWLYTHKPCAFLYRDNLNTQVCWTEFGRKCVNAHYAIHNAQDLDNFIESLCKEQDSLKEQRMAFAQNEVMINYPNATQKIYEHLVQSLRSAK